jgi:AGCS family alanine or glycine:cation symporter
VREGVVAMMGPLIDTLIICTITGLVILSTGVWNERHADRLELVAQSDLTVVLREAHVQIDGDVDDTQRYDGLVRVEQGEPLNAAFVRNHSLVVDPVLTDSDGTPWSGTLEVRAGNIDYGTSPGLWLNGQMALNGSPLTAAAFQRGLSPLGDWGRYLITVSVLLFGLSTAISWSYYGDRAVVYLAGPRWVTPYKVVFCVMHFLGAVFSLEVVWNLGDSALGLMALPNLIGLMLLLRVTGRMTDDYFAKKHTPLR